MNDSKKSMIANIGHWLLVLVGVKGDTNSDVRYMVGKFLNCECLEILRGNMNQLLQDSHGDLLLVSQNDGPVTLRLENRAKDKREKG
ncbi:MAG: D-aminoacyl-tRNA deacylase [Nitrospirales bacterium]